MDLAGKCHEDHLMQDSLIDLEHASPMTRLEAMGARRRKDITKALVVEVKGFHHLAFTAAEGADLSVLIRSKDKIESFPTATAATREAMSIGFGATEIEVRKVAVPTEEDRIRAAVLRLFACILPGEVRRADRKLVTDIQLTAGDAPAITLCGDLALRPEVYQPQRFEKDIIHHGGWVFEVGGYHLAVKVAWQERGRGITRRTLYYARELYISKTPVQGEMIARPPLDDDDLLSFEESGGV